MHCLFNMNKWSVFTRDQHLSKFIGTKESICIKKRVQLPQDWFETPTWPLFYCFGTPIWPPWRHVKTLYVYLRRFPCHFPIYSPFLGFSETEMTHFPALQLMKSLPFQIPETWKGPSCIGHYRKFPPGCQSQWCLWCLSVVSVVSVCLIIVCCFSFGRPSHSAFTNEFFASACHSWRDRLQDGKHCHCFKLNFFQTCHLAR